MPNTSKIHSENLTKPCIVCFGASARPLSDGMKEKIAESVCSWYWELAPYLPSDHRIKLGDGNLPSELPNYDEIAQEQKTCHL